MIYSFEEVQIVMSQKRIGELKAIKEEIVACIDKKFPIDLSQVYTEVISLAPFHWRLFVRNKLLDSESFKRVKLVTRRHNLITVGNLRKGFVAICPRQNNRVKEESNSVSLIDRLRKRKEVNDEKWIVNRMWKYLERPMSDYPSLQGVNEEIGRHGLNKQRDAERRAWRIDASKQQPELCYCQKCRTQWTFGLSNADTGYMRECPRCSHPIYTARDPYISNGERATWS
jgi:hypothetical protein